MQVAIAWWCVLLPGLCWWVWTDQDGRDPVEIMARVLGVSVGFTAVAALMLYLVNLSVSTILLIVYATGLSVLFVGGVIGKKSQMKWHPEWLAGLVFVVGVLLWRFWQAEGLVLPNWVDSLHHTLIVRKMVEAGGLTATLEPYLPGPFYYHFAFHSFTALFSHLSGIDPARSVLLVGQVLIAGTSLAVYSLAKAISGDWRVAGTAALFATFVSKMPGYYLSWGRYTMVAGVLLLGLAAAEMIHLWNHKADWRQGATLLILTAGTLLSHYLTAFLLGLLLLLQGFDWIGESLSQKRWQWGRILMFVFPAVLGLVLVMPWYLNIFANAGSIMKINVLQTVAGSSTSQWDYTRYLLGPETAYVLSAIAFAGAVLALTQREWRICGLWSLIIAGLTLPLSLQITPFRSDYYALLLFLPICVLSALFLFWLSDRLGVILRAHGLTEAIVVALIFCFILSGVSTNSSAVNPQTVLVNQGDLRALDWINEHLPTNARFFVNTTAWGYGVSRGVDGGAWILPYTGRGSIVPTIYYPFSMEKQSRKELMAVGEQAAKISSCDDQFWALVTEQALDYAFLTERAGNLQPNAMENCAGAIKLYQVDGVSVWRLDQSLIVGK